MSRREEEEEEEKRWSREKGILSGSLASLAGISCGDGGPISDCACDRRWDLGQSEIVPELEMAYVRR